MKRGIEKRLALLEEKERRYSGTACVWIETGETVEQAIAHRFNGLLPANIRLIVAGWESAK